MSYNQLRQAEKTYRDFPSPASRREREPAFPAECDGPSVLVAGSAWETLRAMRSHFGSARVSKELYQWFAAEAKTISYGHVGMLHLLGKPEQEALRVMENATHKLAGRKTAIPWTKFVNQNVEIRDAEDKRPRPE